MYVSELYFIHRETNFVRLLAVVGYHAGVVGGVCGYGGCRGILPDGPGAVHDLV